jgi:hypothetical protein
MKRIGDRKMFKYVGKRNPEDSFDLTIEVVFMHDIYTDMVDHTIPLRHIVRHSSTGMEWGYNGSGPSDTALSMLVDFLVRKGYLSNGDKEKALTKYVGPFYMDFRDKYIARAEREGFEITDKQIENFLKGRGAI